MWIIQYLAVDPTIVVGNRAGATKCRFGETGLRWDGQASAIREMPLEGS